MKNKIKLSFVIISLLLSGLNVFSQDFNTKSLGFNIYGNTDTVCSGEKVILTTQITGGTPPYTIYDRQGNIVYPPFYVYPMQTDTFIYTMIDAQGVSASTSYIVYTFQNPEIEFQADIQQGCMPLKVEFSEINDHENAKYVWNFGDKDQNNLSYSENPSHVYKDAGLFSVKLSLTSEQGCTSVLKIDDYISVFPIPEAKFEVSSEIVSVAKPLVDFFNYSKGADEYVWAFGDEDTSYLANPTHNFPVYPTGEYTVFLICNTLKGCSDTAKRKIRIENEHSFYAPNAFTPNNDAVNDNFKVFSNGIDKRNFKLYIIDRWGNYIFETNDINNAWNGRMKNGDYVKSGLYNWYVKYLDESGGSHEKSGVVKVIR